jgi:hypothetical protein
MKKFIILILACLFSIQLDGQNQNLKTVTAKLLAIYEEEAKPYIIEMAEGRLDPKIKDSKEKETSIKTLIGIIETSQSIIKQEVMSRIENDDISIEMINDIIENQYKRFYPSLDYAYYEKVQKRTEAIISDQ